MIDNIKRFQWRWLLFTIPFIVIGIYLYFLNSYSIIDDFDKAGKLGDSFGILNSLFSGLAFIALVITIYLQQQDMRDSKKEMQKQNFETTFFKMIDLYNNVVKNLYLERPIEVVDFFPDGTERFEYLPYEILGQKFFIGSKDCQGKDVILELVKIFDMYRKSIKKYPKIYKVIEGEYEDFYKQYEEVIGHYFRTIYLTLKFIDQNQDISKNDKSSCIDLFLAQFSKKELKLIYFHCKSSIDGEKILPILTKYFPHSLYPSDIEDK